VRKSLHSFFDPRRGAPLLAVLMGAVLLASPIVHAQSVDRPAAGKLVFVSGPATLEGQDGKSRTATAGMEVHQGEQVVTGTDAYVHLRMIDKGFVAVRPHSRLAIVLYEFDEARPSASRIKLQLHTGNTRTVSGKGGEAAKQNYRFNTPMAAIGLRGTDYTVVSSDDATRVSVARGAVAVTPLSESCQAASLGPCSTPGTRELSAAVRHAYLEVSTGARVPVLVRPEQDPQGGGGQNPSGRPQEPSANTGGDLQLADSKGAANQVVADRLAAGLVPEVPDPPAPALLVWGRWSVFAAQGGGSAAVATLVEGRDVLFGNDVFALLRTSGPASALPKQGTVDFKLANSEAYTLANGNLGQASVLGGNLSIDFQQRGFSTALSVQHGEGLEQLHAQGGVHRQGFLNADPRRSNMNLSGVVAGGGAEAAYLFDKPLTSGGLLGAVRWVR